MNDRVQLGIDHFELIGNTGVRSERRALRTIVARSEIRGTAIAISYETGTAENRLASIRLERNFATSIALFTSRGMHRLIPTAITGTAFVKTASAEAFTASAEALFSLPATRLVIVV